MYNSLELMIEGGIANVRLNRPEKHNAINLDMFRELGEDKSEVFEKGNGRNGEI